jgi:hypothetical protein
MASISIVVCVNDLSLRLARTANVLKKSGPTSSQEARQSASMSRSTVRATA